VPFIVTNYWSNAIVIPFLIYTIAALGLNILTGYCGQVSLGTGGFMAVGAYAAFKLMTAFPEINIVFVCCSAGGITAMVGMAFGLPSLRIKGFYLAVATLAAQFFLVWLFNKVPWFYNYSASGRSPRRCGRSSAIAVTGAAATPAAKYLFCLGFVIVLRWIARNLTRGRIGRSGWRSATWTSRPRSSGSTR
jgi:branched-chain amino acid transport system permease protein